MRQKKIMKLASRGKRFGAACIDLVIPAVSCMIVVSTLAVSAITSMFYSPGFGDSFGDPFSGYGYGYGYGFGGRSSGGVVAAMIIAFLLIVVYIVIQLVFFNKSTTMGKAALGMQVVSSTNGEPIGFWKMLFREWIVKKASEAIFLLGYIWILIDEKNRGWHDKILDTYVVDLKESAALAGSRRQTERPYRQPDPAAAGADAIARPAPKSAPVTLAQIEKEPDKQEYIEVDDRAASVRETVMEAADSVAAAADTASEVTVTTDTAATTAPQESMNDNSPENAADDLPESTETESTDVSDENEKQ